MWRMESLIADKIFTHFMRKSINLQLELSIPFSNDTPCG